MLPPQVAQALHERVTLYSQLSALPDANIALCEIIPGPNETEVA